MRNTSFIFGVLLSLLSLLFIGLQTFGGEMTKSDSMRKENMNSKYRTATFAGGCFWCTESDFEKVDGVVEVISGYTGGHKENPTYEEVSAGGTGHVEAVQVIYDPKKVTYKDLLDFFWRHVDPTDPGGQFVDRGSQYKSVIFYHNDKQKLLAEESKMELESSGVFDKPIVTEIVKFTKFYKAEDYHQDYYKKNPLRYKFYRWNSGRDQFLKSVDWSKANNMNTTGMKKPDMKNHMKYSKPSEVF